MTARAQEIKGNIATIERVCNALKLMENEAHAIIEGQPNADEESLKKAKLDYLAIRLQREKLERIKEFVRLYQSNFCNNYFHLNRFYSSSFQAFLGSLGEPTTDLATYMGTLTRRITDEKDNATRKMMIQCAMGLLIALVGLSIMATSIALLNSNHASILCVLGLIGGELLGGLAAAYSSNFYQDRKDMNVIEHFLEQDGLPKCDASQYTLKLITKPADWDSTLPHVISVYWDNDTQEIMCSRYIRSSKAKPEQEVFAITLQAHSEDIKLLLDNLGRPANQPISNTHKTAIFTAINAREFQRYATCKAGQENGLRGKTTTKYRIQETPANLYSRFFGPDNKHLVTNAQQKIGAQSKFQVV
ncbi:MAG: hypothetical protein Q8R24_06745 [Legionellaceae bacterium]|nr:hypothetical protein [Legionellaceae bacterium]